MELFYNADDEDKLCQVLKAYVEEWGPEHVTIAVPGSWRDWASDRLGRVRCEYTTINSIAIRVAYSDIRLVYEVQMRSDKSPPGSTDRCA